MTNLEFSTITQVLRGVDRAGAEGVEGGVGERMRGRAMGKMPNK